MRYSRPTKVNLPNQSTWGSHNLCKESSPREYHNVQPIHMSLKSGTVSVQNIV